MRSTTTDDAPIAVSRSTRPGPTTLSRISPWSGSNAGPSSAASSTSTSGPHGSPGQGQWPSSGTPQVMLPRPRRHRVLPVLRRHPAVDREPQPALYRYPGPAAARFLRPRHQATRGRSRAHAPLALAHRHRGGHLPRSTSHGRPGTSRHRQSELPQTWPPHNELHGRRYPRPSQLRTSSRQRDTGPRHAVIATHPSEHLAARDLARNLGSDPGRLVPRGEMIGGCLMRVR